MNAKGKTRAASRGKLGMGQMLASIAGRYQFQFHLTSKFAVDLGPGVADAVVRPFFITPWHLPSLTAGRRSLRGGCAFGCQCRARAGARAPNFCRTIRNTRRLNFRSPFSGARTLSQNVCRQTADLPKRHSISLRRYVQPCSERRLAYEQNFVPREKYE